MFQFYREIISEGDAERMEIEKGNANLTPSMLKAMLPGQTTLEALRADPELKAVIAVSHKLSTAIISRTRARTRTTKRYQMNFEPQLLLIYFAKFISVMGLEAGSKLVRLEAINTISGIFDSLKEFVKNYLSEEPKPKMWENWNIGQLGFLKRKLKKHRHSKAIDSLFLSLDSRLQEAMATVDPKLYERSVYELPKNTLKFIQKSAITDARITLQALKTKKNRIGMLKSILQRIIKPLAKNILSIFGVFSKKIHGMTFAQLEDLQTFFVVETAKDLGAIMGEGSKRTKSQAAGMKILHLTYDPKTQGGMVLCLRARLGQHFELRFHPIGANGKRKRGGAGKQRDLNPRDPKKQKEEEEEEEEAEPYTILSFPVELIYYITGFMVKSHPTPEETKGLFAFARSTSELRFYIEDPGLENVISRKFLGTQHTRNREERRLGLEPNVAKRYKAVFKLLGFKDKNILALQAKANRNIQTYKIEVEKRKKAKAAKEPREKEWTIRSWPWWYFRALANQRSLQNIIRPFVDQESDALFMSEVSVVAFQLYQRATRWVPGAPQGRWDHFNDSVSEYDMDWLLEIGRNVYDEPELWQIWTSGADLMVIPIDTLVQRALTYSYNIGRKMRLKGPTRLTISVSEPMPVSRPRKGLASFRKEVIMTGLTKLPDTLGRHTQSQGKAEIIDFDLRLVLQIQQAYLGNAWSQFLGPQRKPLPYLHLESLSLQQVHFENPRAPPLDLSALTGEFLSELRFGPTNVKQVPKLFCPSPHLEKLHLVTPNNQNSILLWDLEGTRPASCFPNLYKIHISGNVKIWKSPLILKLAKFPNLRSIDLEKFPGTIKDLERLGLALEQAPRSTTFAPGHYPAGIKVWVRFVSQAEHYYSVEDFDLRFKGVYFKEFFGSDANP